MKKKVWTIVISVVVGIAMAGAVVFQFMRKKKAQGAEVNEEDIDSLFA